MIVCGTQGIKWGHPYLTKVSMSSTSMNLSSTQFEEGFIALDSTLGNYILHDHVATLEVRASLTFDDPLGFAHSVYSKPLHLLTRSRLV
jgi:hypothetical protein